MIKFRKIIAIALTVLSLGFFASTALASSDDVIVYVTPATPTGLTGTSGACGSGQITLSWTASSGATSYTVKNVTTSATQTTANTSYTFTGLSGSTNYNFSVLASNAYGSSSYSSEITAKILCPTGSISSSSCSIPNGSSSCSSTVSWSTNDVLLANLNIKQNETVFYPANTSGSTTRTISKTSATETTTFTLNNNSTFLSSSTATASCASGTGWNGSICASYTVTPSINSGGSISPSSAVSVAYGGTQTFTITPSSGKSLIAISGCSGTLASPTSYTTGAINSNCTVTATFGTTTGALSATNCTIPINGTSCNTSLTWSTTNPYVGMISSVTTNYPTSGSTAGSGNDSSGVSYTITNGSTNFYLYHNSIQLASATATASCASGSSWNGTSCVSTSTTYTVSTSAGMGGGFNPSGPISVASGSTTSFAIVPNSGYKIDSVSGCSGSLSGSTYTTGIINANCTVTATFIQMTGTLSSSNCTISAGNSTCNTSLTWNTYNNIAASSSVTTNYPTSGSTAGSGLSGSSVSYAISHGATDFYLYNNSILLATATATASCTSGTSWNGSYCEAASLPSTPTGLTASLSNCNTKTVAISWSAVAEATSYSLKDGSTVIYTGSTASYSHTGLTLNTTHTYTVASVNSAGTSAYSGSVSVTLPSTCAISAVTITGGARVGAVLTANITPTTALATYQWKAASSYGGIYSNISGATGKTFTLTSTQLNKYIKVTATGASGFSGTITSSYKGPVLSMSGTMSVDTNPCYIQAGSSTCNTSLTWSVTNPVTTAVTTNYPIAGSVVSTSSTGSGVSYAISRGATDFYLYDSELLLATATANAECVANTTWNGTICAAASGTISATDCVIPYGDSVCSSTITWNTVGATDPRLGNDVSGLISSAASGTYLFNPDLNTIYESTNMSNITFYLYDAYTLLMSKMVTPICESGVLRRGTCVPDVLPFIFATSCTVPYGQYYCYSEVSYNSSDGYYFPESVSVRLNEMEWSTNPWGYSLSVGIFADTNPNVFSLYTGSTLMSSVSVTASCESGTAWNGSVCGYPPRALTITKSGTGSGTVTSSPSGISCGSTCSYSFTHGSSVTLTATASTGGNVFAGWSGECSGTSSTCTVTMDAVKNVTATFDPVTVTVTPASTTYYNARSASQTFTFTSTTNLGTTQCRLLNSSSIGITSYASVTSISYTLPSTAGAYGYYIQCRNTTYTTKVTKSSLITVYAVTVSVSATTSYSVNPGSSVSFAYTPSTTAGSTECALLDSTQTALTAYQASSPIVYTVPSSTGSYGYYVRCRHSVATSVTATSSLITVTTSCPLGSTWDGASCVGPTGTLSATDCSISAGESTCNTSLTWSTVNPVGTSAVTTNYPSSGSTAGSGNSGTVNYTIPYGSTDFYLYNNSVQLDQKTATASCASGTVWNNDEDICESTTGTLNASGCIISSGGSSCSTTINWEIFNPVVSTTSLKDLTSNTIIKTISTAENISSMSYSIPAGARSFSLIHNGETIAGSSAVATCASQTEWNGSLCELTSPNIETFVASPSSVVKGRSTVLTWESDPDAVCTGTNFDTGGTASGSVSVSPLVTTTYTLTCSRGTHSTVNEITVKAIDMYIKEQ